MKTLLLVPALAFALGATPLWAHDGDEHGCAGAHCSDGDHNDDGHGDEGRDHDGRDHNGDGHGDEGQGQGGGGSPVDIQQIYGDGAVTVQTGTGNIARIDQPAGPANTYARIVQAGDGNRAAVAQTGSGGAWASVSQTGDANAAAVWQTGAAHDTLALTQKGSYNAALAVQAAYGAPNAAVMSQTGQGNVMALGQLGGGDQAILTQKGDDNAMTLSQMGDGARAVWTQDGSGLRDLGVTQTGPGQITIMQSNGR